jgi:hypothetical protein
MIKKKHLINLFVIVIYLTVLAIWSLKIFLEWGSDFGLYYAGSFFSTNVFEKFEHYRLYEEFFDHKGPVYYLFLKFIGKIVGYGYYQAYLSFYLSILVFYIPIYLTIKKNIKTFVSSLFFIILALLLLIGQDTNASIALFQLGLLTISFYYLLQAKDNFFFFNISYFFFILAVFTRIDSILFFFPFLYYFHLKSRNFYHYIKFFLFYILTIPYIFLFFIITFFETSFYNFYQHNLSFNFWYSQVSANSLPFFSSNIIKKNHLTLLTVGFFLPIVLFLAARVFEKININWNWQRRSHFYSRIFLNKNFKKIILFLIFLSSILIWLKVSDKNYYLFILSAPVLFVSINLGQLLLKPKYLQIMFMPFLLWSLSTEFFFLNKIKKNNFECLRNLFCEYSDARFYKKTIESIKTSPRKTTQN